LSDDRSPVVILSDSFWRRRFAADPFVLGRSVSIAQTPFTVIGVAPPGFGLDRFLHEDFYVPIGVYAAGLLPVAGHPLEDRGRRYLSIYGRRIAPLSSVQADVSSIAAELSREFPLTNHQQKAVVMTEFAARRATAGSMQAVAWILLALAALSLAAALLCSGAFLLGQMLSASRVDLGYRTGHILTMTFDPSETQSDESRTRAFYRELLERVPPLPGVRAAALAQFVPLGFTAAQKQVKIIAFNADPISIWMNTVTPGYFVLMRMPLVAGRDFRSSDTDRAPTVAVVNEALARFWPGGRAVGQRMEIEGRQVEVIGVVKTAQYQQVGEAPRPFLYLPCEQNFVPRLTLHVQTFGEPSAMTPSVLAVARAIDPTQPVSEIRPLSQFLSRGALYTARIGVAVTAAAGGCAWALSLAGLYACIAGSVHRRRREIGIRRALGASRWSVTRLVLSQGARLILSGVAIGLLLAALAQSQVAPQIGSATGAIRLLALALAGMVVTATSLAACLVPAWRASREDPAVALRRP
jgi:putative ABC transport system permease protein